MTMLSRKPANRYRDRSAVPGGARIRTFEGLPTFEIPIDNEEGTAEDIRKFVHAQLNGHLEFKDMVDDVAKAAQKMFECAAALCRELTTRRPTSTSKKRQFLQRLQKGPVMSLYDTYHAILAMYFDEEEDPETIQQLFETPCGLSWEFCKTIKVQEFQFGSMLREHECVQRVHVIPTAGQSTDKRSEDCERPTAELVKVSKRKLKASADIDGITAALVKLNERLDFLEATIFGWTLPIEQVHHKQTQNFEEGSNPWAEALARRRKVAHQSLSGSTAYDSSYDDASISVHISGGGSGSIFSRDFDTFQWDGQSASARATCE
ncbi:hypothetical protein B0H13DRAFT_1888288 [Mycena leptocephala]|nr:hypothetical protein B0H13DRAFT_1888288 [Mycena leptocephala]